jgi:chemotaxis protein CheX
LAWYSVEDEQPIGGEIRDALVEPFIAAARAALGEMAGAELVVQAVYQSKMHRALGDIAAVVELKSSTGALLVLGFPQRTAAGLTQRILAGLTQQLDDNLIRDCVGEIANVVAGQAKAMLGGGPYRLSFSIPHVLAEAKEWTAREGLKCLVVAFGSAEGDFAVQLFGNH